MRALRRGALTLGVMITALLPVVAAVTPDRTNAPVVPMAITQPLGRVTANPFGASNHNGSLPESALMVLVGSGLLGLASVVRRTTGI